jgi:hypothetical protein
MEACTGAGGQGRSLLARRAPFLVRSVGLVHHDRVDVDELEQTVVGQLSTVT